MARAFLTDRGTLVGMRICVFGVGGVGGYFGGRLAASGNSVAFIARGATLDALRNDGLRVESPLGDISLPDVEATDDPAEVGEVDAVILGVKAWQVPGVAEAARPMIGANTVVVPLQNGVEAAVSWSCHDCKPSGRNIATRDSRSSPSSRIAKLNARRSSSRRRFSLCSRAEHPRSGQTHRTRA